MSKKPYSDRGDLLRALIFLPLGLFLLCFSVWLIQYQLDFLAHAQRAEGHVSALNAGGSHPQIDFADATGKAVSFPQGGLIFGYAVGDSVTVLYRAESPSSTASLESLGALWGANLMVGMFAIVFTAGGGTHLAAWIRRSKTAQPWQGG